MAEESDCLELSVWLRAGGAGAGVEVDVGVDVGVDVVLGLGSADESRLLELLVELLLEKGSKLDDRRTLLGFIWGMCSTCGDSSDTGLEPPDELLDDEPSLLDTGLRSSSDILPLSSSTGSSMRSLTRGK